MKLALTVLLATVASATVQHYHGYSVYRLRPSNETQLKILQDLEDQDVDFWRKSDQVNRIADVMLTPKNKEALLKYFENNGLQYELLIPDVEQLVESERLEQKAADELLQARWPSGTQVADQAIPGFWYRYQRADQMIAFVDVLASKNPELVKKITIGRSYQGRDLVVARIGANSSNQKPVIWIQGGIHAREWISPATVTYFAQQLVNRYLARDADVTSLLQHFDFYIIPVLNMDGYEYTHTQNRLWRKTRKPSNSWICTGTDANRNYGYKWGGQGASSNPCTETFRGDNAFSEPEVRAETNFVRQFGSRLKAYVAVHSYGQYFLYPWGYGRELAPDNAELNRVARLAVAAWNQVSPGTRFTVGTAAQVLYAASGGADDWAYGSANAKYAYTIELPDTGRHGFNLPPSEIVPVGRAFTNAFIALAKAVKARG